MKTVRRRRGALEMLVQRPDGSWQVRCLCCMGIIDVAGIYLANDNPTCGSKECVDRWHIYLRIAQLPERRLVGDIPPAVELHAHALRRFMQLTDVPPEPDEP